MTRTLQIQIKPHAPDALRESSALGVALFHVLCFSGASRGSIKYFLFGILTSLAHLFFAISAFAISHTYYGKSYYRTPLRYIYINRSSRAALPFYFVPPIPLSTDFKTGSQLSPLQEFSLTFTFPFQPGKHETLVGGGYPLGLDWLLYISFLFILCICRSITSLTIISLAPLMGSIFRPQNRDSRVAIQILDSILFHTTFLSAGITYNFSPEDILTHTNIVIFQIPFRRDSNILES